MRLISENKPLGFLLAEDDTVAAIELECILEDMGHIVTAVAVAPRAAEKALARHRSQIDAVIFGATLVGLPAFSLARTLALSGCPAIVTSTQPKAVVRALGFTEPYLEKPYSRLAVNRLVRTLESQIVAPAA